MKVYTKTGDDGTTGLYFGGRVAKDDVRPAAYGDVDEAQASLGVVRSLTDPDHEVGALVLSLQRDLWIVMADLATGSENRAKLVDGSTKVNLAMVSALERSIDSFAERTIMPNEFVVPGNNQQSAAFDVARTVVRRAERSAVAVDDADSLAVMYLNRLSDLLFTLARYVEHESTAVRAVESTLD